MEPKDDVRRQDAPSFKSLPILDLTSSHKFIKTLKRIGDVQDVTRFQTSRAYVDICTFIMQLNRSMCSRKIEKNNVKQVVTWELGSPAVIFPEPVKRLQSMLQCIEAIIEEAPPDTGPRRFGNISFRKWYELLASRVSEILNGCLPPHILEAKSSDATAQEELSSYLLGGFGSPQRLDYGTGHELSFLAFLGCIWKLGGFHAGPETYSDGTLERSVVLGIIEPYLRLVRRLIITYTLEPAGSHGVWGLDDHTYLPYIFGSAQYCPAITGNEGMPVEGSLPNTPNPGDVAKRNIVDRERHTNMYFAAIGFINDVKTGPFWEHSPILFDISGIRSGWAKINKGMIKMYNAEVLSKFPVVQHFHFGSLFSWDQEPFLVPPPSSIRTSSRPIDRTRTGNTAAT